MTKIIQNIQGIIDNYAVRTEKLEGRDYYVAPVIMLKEGVHVGSGGPAYYPADEIKMSAPAWNGVPVTLNHPDDAGLPCSANSPEKLTKHKIGRIFNAVFEDGDLKAEVWLDIIKTKELAPGVLDLVKSNGRLPVSTGLFTLEDGVPGEWSGEEYRTSVNTFRPDHLALLPEDDGACSWDDGCGIRVNMDGEVGMRVPTVIGLDDARRIGLLLLNFSNKRSMDSTMGAVYRVVNSMDTKTAHYYVRDVFKDFVVFEKFNPTNNEQAKLYKQSYTIDENDTATLTGEPKEVKVKVSYNEVKQNRKTQNKEETKMSNQEKCCAEKVQLLIENEATPFSEDNRAWLEGMSEDQIEKLMPLTKEPEETAVANAAQKGHDDAVGIDPDEVKAIKDIIAANKTKAPEVDPEVPTADSAEAYIANAPEELQEVLKASLALHRKKKADIITAITANKANKFTENQLIAMDMATLENLAELAQVKNFRANGGGTPPEDVTTNEAKVEALVLPDMWAKDKE